MEAQELAAAIATAGNLFVGLLYIRSVLRKETKPHVFTWAVWGLLNGIGAAVAFSQDAMNSFFVLGASSIISLLTAAFGLWKGDKYIKRADIVALISALLVISIWFSTKDALIAALLICFINICGGFPTYRKAWALPFEENRNVFAFYSASTLFGLLSVTPFTLTSTLYPALIFLSNVFLVIIITWRRKSSVVVV